MEDPLENVFKKQNKIAKDPEKTVKVNLIDSSHKYNIPGKFFLNANDQIVNAVTILSRGYQLLKNNGTSKLGHNITHVAMKSMIAQYKNAQNEASKAFEGELLDITKMTSEETLPKFNFSEIQSFADGNLVRQYLSDLDVKRQKDRQPYDNSFTKTQTMIEATEKALEYATRTFENMGNMPEQTIKNLPKKEKKEFRKKQSELSEEIKKGENEREKLLKNKEIFSKNVAEFDALRTPSEQETAEHFYTPLLDVQGDRQAAQELVRAKLKGKFNGFDLEGYNYARLQLAKAVPEIVKGGSRLDLLKVTDLLGRKQKSYEIATIIKVRDNQRKNNAFGQNNGVDMLQWGNFTTLMNIYRAELKEDMANGAQISPYTFNGRPNSVHEAYVKAADVLTDMIKRNIQSGNKQVASELINEFANDEVLAEGVTGAFNARQLYDMICTCKSTGWEDVELGSDKRAQSGWNDIASCLFTIMAENLDYYQGNDRTTYFRAARNALKRGLSQVEKDYLSGKVDGDALPADTSLMQDQYSEPLFKKLGARLEKKMAIIGQDASQIKNAEEADFEVVENHKPEYTVAQSTVDDASVAKKNYDAGYDKINWNSSK